MNSPKTTDLDIAVAGPGERHVLERLWGMFRHDMSAYSGALPDEHGRFRQERLDASLTDRNWVCYLMRLGSAPVGFAIIRDVLARERIISSFFLVHAVRRQGRGTHAVRTIVHEHPGAWAVPFQDANTAASAFWRSVAAAEDPAWTAKHQGHAGRPDLPADSWVRFTVK